MVGSLVYLYRITIEQDYTVAIEKKIVCKELDAVASL